MKKILLLLAFVVPTLCIAQDKNVKLGDSGEKSRDQESGYEQQKQEKMQQLREREQQQEMMSAIKNISSNPDYYAYLDLLVVNNGKQETVMINVSRSTMSLLSDERERAALEQISQKNFSSLTEALNEFSTLGWDYLDSYALGSKESALKVVLRKGVYKDDNRSRR